MPPAAIFATCTSPWGPIHVAVSDRGIAAITMLAPEESFVGHLERRLHGDVVRASLVRRDGRRPTVDRLIAGLDAHLGGHRGALTELADLPLDLAGRRAWDLAVLAAVGTIAWGSVTSYGRLARLIGRPGAARAAGGAVGRNPVGLLIPCHRVIAGDGSLGGYGGDWWGDRERLLTIKRELLAIEGVALPARFDAVP